MEKPLPLLSLNEASFDGWRTSTPGKHGASPFFWCTWAKETNRSKRSQVENWFTKQKITLGPKIPNSMGSIGNAQLMQLIQKFQRWMVRKLPETRQLFEMRISRSYWHTAKPFSDSSLWFRVIQVGDTMKHVKYGQPQQKEKNVVVVIVVVVVVVIIIIFDQRRYPRAFFHWWSRWQSLKDGAVDGYCISYGKSSGLQGANSPLGDCNTKMV